jgi:hypothetical protein
MVQSELLLISLVIFQVKSDFDSFAPDDAAIIQLLVLLGDEFQMTG